MIRKPKDDDFREGMAVTVLRGSKMIAVETGKGASSGISKVATYWLAGTMGFGLLMSILPNLSAEGFYALLLITIVTLSMYRKGGTKKSSNASDDRPARARQLDARRPTPGEQGGELALEIAALTRRAVSLILPALFMFLLARLGLPSFPLMAVGIAMFALAVLLGARIFSDRTVLRYDGQSVTVTGLLGTGEMMWIDVEDITVQTCSRFNLRILFTTGVRRNLVISARCNRLGGATDLYVPIDLLGLDKERLVALISTLLGYRAGLGEPIPAARRPAPTPLYDGGLDQAFDPDAIMARYLAERSELIADVRPDLPQPSGAPRPAFGRKIAR